MRHLPLIAVISLCALFTSANAVAGGGKHHQRHKETYFDSAKVIKVKPIIRHVRIPIQHRKCRKEKIVRHRHSKQSTSYAPMILGGIVGGVVGNQLGGGRGKDIMTVAGAVLGATVTHNLTQRPRTHNKHYRTKVRRCKIHKEYRKEKRTEGYRVTYRYRGRIFVTRMANDPGRRIRLKVKVEPTDADLHADVTGGVPYRL